MSLRDFGLLVAVCLVWAANSVVSKVIISHFGVPPLFYTAARFVVVVVATAPWLLPAPRPMWRMIAVGLLMGGGSFALTFIGLETTTPSAAAVVGQLGIPIATVLSVLLLGEKIGWRRGLGIVLALGGALLVMWDRRSLVPSVGLLFVAASALTGALGAVMMKQIQGVRPLQFQAWVGFASLWPVAALSLFAEKGQAAAVVNAPWVFTAAVLFSGLVVSVAAHTAYYGLIQRYDVNLLQPLTLMMPLATIGLGVAFTHDAFGPRMAAGTVLALSGVLIIALRRNHVMPLILLLRNRAQ
ncbi:MAG TPA: DMT family transporter [Caulobacteraceae bacterium]